MGKPFEGERSRLTHDPETGEWRLTFTPEYEAWWRAKLDRAEADERTVEQWMLNGMKGRLVRRGDGPVTVDPCDPDDDGQAVIFEYPEGE